MKDKLIEPVDPVACRFCHSKYAPRLYGWHENAEARYAVRCLNCGAQGPKKEIGPLAIEAWNAERPDPEHAAALARINELERRECVEALARIEALETQLETYRYANERWNEREQEQEARIGELESLVAATEEMREDWQDEARKWQRKGRELEQQLAAPRWEPVNPIGMVNDEYADCDIKLCYRLVQPTQAQDE